MSKKALITGITGQDGSYLAEFLLAKGYEVHGVIRRSSSFNTERIDHLYLDRHVHGAKLYLHYGDLSDSASVMRLMHDLQPDEVYHLGAQSHVRVSFDVPEYTGDVTGIGTTRILEAIRESCPKARFYQASSSEMYGLVQAVPQREDTPFYPRSPYGAAKVYAYWMTVNYRESYGDAREQRDSFQPRVAAAGRDVCDAQDHARPGPDQAGLQKELYLGNLDAKRDWGYAPEYVEAQWLMLQQDKGDDFVIATGETHSIREFLDEAFGCVEPGLERLREDRSALLPARGGRPAHRRCVKGEEAFWAGSRRQRSPNW